MSGGHGKCVEILHVMGDTLGQLGKPPTRPSLGPPSIGVDSNKLENLGRINEITDKPVVDAVNDLEICSDSVLESESCEVIVRRTPMVDS